MKPRRRTWVDWALELGALGAALGGKRAGDVVERAGEYARRGEELRDGIERFMATLGDERGDDDETGDETGDQSGDDSDSARAS